MASTGSKKNIYINGLTCGQPVHSKKMLANGTAYGGAASGADGDENILVIDGQQLEYHILGTSTFIGFAKTATGLQLPVDATDNDGIELTGGILAQNKSVFTVGTDGAFHINGRFNLTTNATFDVLMVGFRTVEAYQKPQAPAAGLTLYNTLGAVGIYDLGTPFTTIYTVTDKDATTFSAVDSTDVITATTPFEFQCNISTTGAMTFKHDIAANANPATAPTLVAPTVNTNTQTFAVGDTVTPFVLAIAGATAAGVATLIKLDIGLDEA